MKRLLITLSLVALVLAGCGSADPTPAPPASTALPAPAELVEATAAPIPATVTPIPPTVTPVPATPTPASRCQPAPAILLDSITQGLTVDGGGDLRNGWIVRSADYEQAYFVAADITGPGMDNAIGLWVTNDPDGLGAIFSVDAFANEFSDWADGRATSAAFSQSNDGAREALDCASQ